MRNEIRTAILSIAIVFSLSSYAQNQSCSCTALFDELVKGVQANYGGYLHKVKEASDSSAYIKLRTSLREKSIRTSFTDCYDVLKAYVNFFNDGHLFVMEAPPGAGSKSDSLRKLIRTIPVTESLLSRLQHNNTKNPIEGIWYSDDMKLGIVSDGPRRFAAVTLKSNNPAWQPGMVKFEIRQMDNGAYAIKIFRGDFTPIRFEGARIFKECMLGFGVYRFAKETGNSPERKYIDPKDPEMPVVRKLDEKTVLITVPSALINPGVMDSVLKANKNDLTAAENLIVDIRANLGGNFIWGGLNMLANTEEDGGKKNGDKEGFLILGSEDNAKYVDAIGGYYRRAKDSAGIAHYNGIVDRIRKGSGTPVPFSFYSSPGNEEKAIIYPFPKRVAVIMDKATASAAEAFVLGLKENSKKLVLYGSNSYGMIDYMNVQSLKLACTGNDTYYYGYGTFFSPRIKTTRYNGVGIKPDVYVPKSEPDWIEWVRKDLNKRQ